MTITLLREKSPEYEAFLFEGVEESGEAVEEFLGDAFESLIPTENRVVFKVGSNRKYEETVEAGQLILKEIFSSAVTNTDWQFSVADKDDLAEGFEAVAVP